MPAPSNYRDTKWADGLRGIASLLVVTAHIARSLAPHLLNPTLTDHGPSEIMQLPFLRCFIMGRASVAAFAILSGYVNGLKPTRQLRAGQVDACLAGVAKSAYRRTGRLIIPAILATMLSWAACQLGAFRFSRTVDSAWIRDTSPEPSPSFPAAIGALLDALATTWTSGANPYDPIQWTLSYLLRGSMLVYLSLFATAYLQPRFRAGVYGMLLLYYWKMGDVIGINIFAGLVMAELTYSPAVQEYIEDRPVTFAVLSSSSIVLGIFTISYPEENPEWADWSKGMLQLGHYIFPAGSEFNRFYPGMGAQLICFGIMFNATAKRLLSTAWPCYLGKVSFAIYLLHAPLLRTVLTWMLFGLSHRPPSPGADKEGEPLPQPWVPLFSRWATFVLIPLFYVILYRTAALWVHYVDPFCGRVTNWIEERIFRDESKNEKQTAPA